MNRFPTDLVIAIDGPAGAGKSTVAQALASRLGLRVLDTGAMYRAFGVLAVRQGLTLTMADELTALAERTSVSFDDADRVWIEGEDVSDAIRSLEAGQAASEFSTVPGVRRRMVELQQAVIRTGSWVLEGRDVTTVVAPEAQLKIFLTASIEERARRRWLQMKSETVPSLQSVVKDVVERDHRDYTRADSPLCLGEDVVIIESFGLTVDQVVDAIVRLT